MSGNKAEALQDPFLNALRLQEVSVSIYLVNGIKLQGRIKSFDPYVLLLENTVVQMVYKHAVSTILPGKMIDLSSVVGKKIPEKTTTEVPADLTNEVRKHGLDLVVKYQTNPSHKTDGPGSGS